MDHNDYYGLIYWALKDADRQLDIFKKDLSPTALEAVGKHIAQHSIAIRMVEPDMYQLIRMIMGLCIKLTCEKETRAFLKAEEAADAATNK